MGQKLADFFKQLHRSPKLRAAYRANPKAFINASELKPSHKRIVMAGNAKAIGRALVDEHIDAHEPGDPIKPLNMPVCCIIN